MAAGVTASSKALLAEELAVAANVPLVVDAVVRSYGLEATRRTGWPVTRWLVRFRPDPLRRLNLRREGARPGLNSTSMPPAGARSGPARMLLFGNLPTRPPTASPAPGGPLSGVPPVRAGSSFRMHWIRPLPPRI